MNKRKIIYIGIAILLIAALLLPTSCLSKKSSAATTTSTGTLAQDVDNLEADVADLYEKYSTIDIALGDIEAPDYVEDIDDLLDRVAELETKIEELETQAPEDNPEEDTPTDEICRWYPDIYTNQSTSDIEVTDYEIRPSRIEEDGDYSVYVTLTNLTGGDIDDIAVAVVLIPASGCRSYLDASDTYMDAASSPYVYWDTEITTGGSDNYARRITCTSDDNYEVLAGDSIEIKLYLVLTYQ